MNTIDTRSEVNEALRRAFALSRRGRDLLLFSLLCGDEGDVEFDDQRQMGKRWHELTGRYWNSTRWAKAAVEVVSAGFLLPCIFNGLVGAVQGQKSNQIGKNDGFKLNARVVLRQLPLLLPRHSLPTRRNRRAENRFIRSRRNIRRDLIDLKKSSKKSPPLDACVEFDRVSASVAIDTSEASNQGSTVNLSGLRAREREDNNDERATKNNEASFPPPPPDGKAEGDALAWRPKDLLETLAEKGRVIDVNETLADAVDRAFQGEPNVTVAGINDVVTSPPPLGHEKGQASFFEQWRSPVGEEVVDPKKEARALASKLVTFWGARSNRHRVKVTAKRVNMVRARLREGFTRDDLHRAIAGVCYSPFHREGGYDTIEVAIRSEEQVEKGIRLWLLHAPIELVAQHEQRTGESTPERAEELATYRRREASKLRAVEREREGELCDRTREGEGRADEPRRRKTAEELFANVFKKREEKHENEKRARRIEVLRVEIEIAKEYNEKEELAKLEEQLEELLKKQD